MFLLDSVGTGRGQNKMYAKVDNKIHFDIFLSAPMSGFNNSESYEANREQVLEILKHLRTNTEYKNVFYAGESISSFDSFDDTIRALEIDIDAIRRSSIFIMLYPMKMASSALVEAGYALARMMPCLFFVKNIEDLPYMLRSFEHKIDNKDIPPVAVWKYNGIEDIIKGLESSVGPLLLEAN